MNIKRILRTVVKSKILGMKYPLAVRINITSNCDYDCKYCIHSNIDSKNELNIEDFIDIIPILKNLGVERISLSGGNPALKDGVGRLIESIFQHGISVIMNSNGSNLEMLGDSIKRLDMVQLSLDSISGKEDARGKRAYEDVLSAIKYLSERKIKYLITTTITKFNVSNLTEMVSFAKKYNTMVSFQPVKNFYSSNEIFDIIKPDIRKYRESIKKLISLKHTRMSQYIRNSKDFLRYIYDWPDYKNMRCTAGTSFFIIESDGTIMPCDRISVKYSQRLPNIKDIDWINSLKNLPDVNELCNGCGFCGAQEINYFFNNNYFSLLHILRL